MAATSAYRRRFVPRIRATTMLGSPGGFSGGSDISVTPRFKRLTIQIVQEAPKFILQRLGAQVWAAFNPAVNGQPVPYPLRPDKDRLYRNMRDEGSYADRAIGCCCCSIKQPRL